MPLFDHYHLPMLRRFPPAALHSAMATFLATHLAESWLPPSYVAVENVHQGTQFEIDVATYDTHADSAPAGNGAVAAPLRTWAAPLPRATAPIEFADEYEVLVYADEAGWQLVGAIELISRKNKDRPGRRRDFVRKCATLLKRGVSVVMLDVVTDRHANLHNQLLRALRIEGDAHLDAGVGIYASSYRPLSRGDETEMQVWAEPCAVGQVLPTMPLRLTGDVMVPVEFEAAYGEICRRRNLG